MKVFAAWLPLVMCILVFVPDTAHARQWYFEPEVTVSAGYNDNPRLLSEETVDDSELASTTLSSGNQQRNISHGLVGTELIAISRTEVDEISGLVILSATRHSESELDSEQTALELAYAKRGERSDYFTTIRLSEDSSFESELLETGVSVLGIERQEVAINSGITHQFSTKLTGSVEADVRNIDYQGTSSSFVNYDEYTITGSLEQALTERLSLSYAAEISQYRPDSNIETPVADQDTTSWLAGLTYRITETFSSSFVIGPTYLRSKGGGTEAENLESDDMSFNLQLDYVGLRNNFNVEFERTRDVSSLGGVFEVDYYQLGWQRAQTLGGVFSLDATMSDQGGGPISSNVRSLSISPTLEIPINLNNTFSFMYRHIDQKVRTESSTTELSRDRNASSNSALVSWIHTFRRIRLN